MSKREGVFFCLTGFLLCLGLSSVHGLKPLSEALIFFGGVVSLLGLLTIAWVRG